MSARASKRGVLFAYLLTALVAAIAGFSIYEAANRPAGDALPGVAFAASGEILGAPRPDFTLNDLAGNPTSIGRWDGDVVLVNFWATWCPPCRKEIPGFAALQQQYGDRGFQVVGVAIDLPEAVAQFTEDLGADYPQLVGREDAIAVADRYGNQHGALPYSVLIDREGVIRFVKPGELKRQELESELVKLL